MELYFSEKPRQFDAFPVTVIWRWQLTRFKSPRPFLKLNVWLAITWTRRSHHVMIARKWTTLQTNIVCIPGSKPKLSRGLGYSTTLRYRSRNDSVAEDTRSLALTNDLSRRVTSMIMWSFEMNRALSCLYLRVTSWFHARWASAHVLRNQNFPPFKKEGIICQQRNRVGILCFWDKKRNWEKLRELKRRYLMLGKSQCVKMMMNKFLLDILNVPFSSVIDTKCVCLFIYFWSIY